VFSTLSFLKLEDAFMYMNGPLLWPRLQCGLVVEQSYTFVRISALLIVWLCCWSKARRLQMCVLSKVVELILLSALVLVYCSSLTPALSVVWWDQKFSGTVRYADDLLALRFLAWKPFHAVTESNV